MGTRGLLDTRKSATPRNSAGEHPVEPPPRSINPATEEVLRAWEFHTRSEVETILDRAAAGFRRWRGASPKERAIVLGIIGSQLRKNKATLAHTVTIEMGKPIGQAEAEVEKCAWVCEYYAENGERLLADEPVQTNAAETYVSFLPLGVIAAVMPWNFPLWQVFRAGTSALMAGNALLLKHAPNVLLTSFAIEKILPSGRGLSK